MRRLYFFALLVGCLCVAEEQSLGEFAFELPDGLIYSDGMVVESGTGNFIPLSEIGLDIPAGIGIPVGTPYGNPTIPDDGNTAVLSIMPIGDSITAGATITGNRARESYRPFLWQDIHTYGPELITSGAVSVDFRGEFNRAGMRFWGDNTSNNGMDALSGPNPVLLVGSNDPTYMGPNNSFGIPAFDDDSQAGRGLSAADFTFCGPGLAREDCNRSMPGINGFDQTVGNLLQPSSIVSEDSVLVVDVPLQSNAVKWVADQSVDIATIMLGTNDILNQENFDDGFSQIDAKSVADRIIRIIDELEKANPNVSVFVSQVPTMWEEVPASSGNWLPRFDDDDGVYGAHNEVVWMNDAIASKIALLDSTYDVTLVEIDPLNVLWNPSTPGTWMLPTDGGVHPSTAGDDWIASRFFAAMNPNLAVKARQVSAVPEPNSFVFLGLIGLVAGAWSYFRKNVAR